MLKLLRKYDKISDAELMRRFQSDDVRAFEELFERYNQRILGYFIKFFSNRDEAEDLCQELFMRLVDRKQQFDVTKNFKPWLFTIASNMAKTHIVKVQRLKVSRHVEEEELSEGTSIDRIELKKEIRTAVLQLDEVHKTTFIMRHYNHMSIREIAETLDCKEGTIKSRLFTANQRIRTELKEIKEYYKG